ncbi:MAG: cation transporter [Candidatus Marinimicrobia bacterium]|nr:cation transporter [Candidatus Neomarinimicrobiota bacterium]MBL7109010.1 cation transporter [Candidatus Neomarinimicrobiota bacterium]
MSHSHSHGHHHHHNHKNVHRTRLWWAFWINFCFLIIEVLGGIYTNSLALLSDAGHMLTDVGALGLAIIVSKLAQRPRDEKRTFGYMRAEIIGAFINGATLVAICGFILFESFERFRHPQEILGIPMLIVAVLGLLANLISAWILMGDRKKNLNIEGAFLHMIFDAIGSVGAIISGLAIWLWDFQFMDIIASVMIVVLILIGTKTLLKQSINILMNAAPEHIDFHKVKNVLLNMEHITEIHDLHIWTITEGQPALSVHIKVSDHCHNTHHWSECLKSAQQILDEQFGIKHCTIQIEPENFEELNHHCDEIV